MVLRKRKTFLTQNIIAMKTIDQMGYLTPEFEVFNVNVEAGFLNTNPGGSEGTGEDEW